jgi:phenylacetate-CoA ligase
MARLVERFSHFMKGAGPIDHALRYNPPYYTPVRRLLQRLDGMDRAERAAVSDRLLRRAFGWAARLPGAPSADVPLSERPIIEKEDLRDRPQSYILGGLVRIPAATSGSTGVPVRLTRSLRCVAAEQAFIDALLDRWNLRQCDARWVRLRADPVKALNDKEPPYGVYANGGRKLILSSNHLNASTVEWFRDELRRFRPQVMFTHASSGETLARLLAKRGETLDIPLVLTSSEVLTPVGRQLLEKTFNAKVIDYYGMSERVVFAAAESAAGYYFNPLYGRVELLEVDDPTVPPGQRAYEIVGSGFWNDAMPLLRYRSGDCVIVPDHYGPQDLEDVALGLKPVLGIQGREREHIISPSGVTVVGLTYASAGVPGLLRMQLIQDTPDEVRVLAVADPQAGRIDQAMLMRNLRQWIPAEIDITITQVEETEHLPSGKTPFVICRVPAPA